MDNADENPAGGDVVGGFTLDGKEAEVVRFSESDIPSIKTDLDSLAGNLTKTDLDDSVFAGMGEPHDLEKAFREEKARKIENHIREGNLLCIRVNGKVVAIQGLNRFSTMSDGRPLIEISKTATLEEYREKGLAKTLAFYLFSEQMKKNPNVVWVAFSRNPDAIAGLESAGWKTAAPDSDNVVATTYAKEMAVDGELMEKFCKDGYKVVYFDPEEKTAVNEDRNIINRDINTVMGMDVLKYLNEQTVLRVKSETNGRKERLDALQKECDSDADKMFHVIFGVKSSGMQMVIREYGIYFYHGNFTAFQKIVPSFSPLLHGGVMIGQANKSLAKRPEFLGMVGFGAESSSGHEFIHMFNAMLPLNDVGKEYRSMQTDPSRPIDKGSIGSTKEEHYRLWANSILKDEILARIDNDQILKAEEQTYDDIASGGGKLFTTYGPSTLYEYMSPYEADTSEYGTDPISRKESDAFDVLYKEAIRPTRQHYLSAYNQTIRAIKNAISEEMPKAKIKAIIIDSPFDEIADSFNFD